jgi:CoA:oxalate CoA-transferase
MKPPLTGVTVIDFSELLPGPFLTQNLCELGADVIKIERPPHGDNARRLAPGIFAAVNRGKRSVVADLKQEGDRAKVRELVAGADILVETYRPGVMTRLGLDYDSLAKDFPELIYASLTGFGQDGPLAHLPGHDLNYLAASGAIALSGSPGAGPAHAFGLPTADLCGAMYGMSAVLAALYQRRDTGKGQYLDISITDCMVHWLNPRIGHFHEAGMHHLPDQRHDVLIKPAYGVFRTLDGRHITIGALEDHFWARLVKALGMSEFQSSAFDSYPSRVVAANAINTLLAQKVNAFHLEEIERLLREADVPVTPVVAPLDVAKFEQFAQRGLTVETAHGTFARFPVRLSGISGVPCDPPALGTDKELPM